MRHSAIVAVSLGLFAVLFAGLVAAVAIKVGPDHISGRVFDSSTNRGISGMSVRLTAPRALAMPERITVTDDKGDFAFTGLTAGRYLLAIYSGTALLYRKEIDNSAAQTFTVPLRPVAQ